MSSVGTDWFEYGILSRSTKLVVGQSTFFTVGLPTDTHTHLSRSIAAYELRLTNHEGRIIGREEAGGFDEAVLMATEKFRHPSCQSARRASFASICLE